MLYDIHLMNSEGDAADACASVPHAGWQDENELSIYIAFKSSPGHSVVIILLDLSIYDAERGMSFRLTFSDPCTTGRQNVALILATLHDCCAARKAGAAHITSLVMNAHMRAGA